MNDGQFLNKVRNVPAGSGKVDLHNLVFPVSLKFFFIASSLGPTMNICIQQQKKPLHFASQSDEFKKR